MKQKKYSISEVAELLSYETHVLRYYESEFDIKVPRNKGNRREYTIKEIEIFQYVKDLKEQGFNNSQIKQILKSPTIQENGNYQDLDRDNGVAKIEQNELAITLELINKTFINNFNEINQNIHNLKNDIQDIKHSHNNEEQDILLAENAKLKMRLKEKAYELVDIKERYTKLEKKKFIFKKFFK
ncbi:MAG: helix-turn-helix domain-containing protein [Eubacteriales bacterium]